MEESLSGQQTLDYESKMLLQFCQVQEHLLTTYTALSRINGGEEQRLQTHAEEVCETA